MGSLPFFVADPKAFVDDTVKYGAGTYRIVGYGLSAILVRAGIVEDREGEYPFVLFALLLWLPLTVWLLLLQRKSDEAWLGAAGFALSILVLLFVGRTFNNYYLVWPATGAAVACADRGLSAYRYERPVRYTRFESATTGLAYFPWLSRQRTRPVRVL